MADTQRSTLGPLPFTPKAKTISFALMFIGAVGFAISLMTNAERAWHAYLVAYFYFFLLGIGGLFFAAIQHVSKAGWSVNVRRFCESFTAFLPVAALGAIGVALAGHHLYEWMDKAEVAKDPLLAHKAGYLNTPFFIIRLVVFFGGWLLFTKKMVGGSIMQDKNGDPAITVKTLPWAIGFLLFFAISFSLFSVDLLMSLMPHWFSTIFGIYTFAGLFQSTMATMILLILYCMRRGLLNGYVDENHMHDLGKFMFAFTVFWAYIAYSQYMLIWYANLPEETMFYLPRVTGPWTWVSVALLLFKFVVPFLALLSRRAKRNLNFLATIAILILIMQYVDLYWLVYPNLSSEKVIFGLPEITTWCGFAGVFMFTVGRFLSKYSIVPLKDPRIHESLHHHVVY
ncbi:MAG: molybdopterin oxidoreductase [Bdellovibrionales bacterium]|nr:molybdopterin oxidoreductase [Bdellovibrionales bacterium]